MVAVEAVIVALFAAGAIALLRARRRGADIRSVEQATAARSALADAVNKPWASDVP